MEYGTAVAGVLAIPLSSVPRDYLLLFRSEEAHNVEWAGEPGKKAVATADGMRLSPRGSFATWREDVRGRSKPWTDPELAVAEAIRTYLRDIVLRHNEITAEERARAEKRRRVLNDELNHRVKNIIAPGEIHRVANGRPCHQRCRLLHIARREVARPGLRA